MALMPASPSDRFLQFLNERPNAESAAAFGTHYTTLWRVAVGIRRPSLDLAFAIERATRRWHGGQIKATEWIASPEAARRHPPSRTSRSGAPPAARQARRAGGAR